MKKFIKTSHTLTHIIMLRMVTMIFCRLKLHYNKLISNTGNRTLWLWLHSTFNMHTHTHSLDSNCFQIIYTRTLRVGSMRWWSDAMWSNLTVTWNFMVWCELKTSEPYTTSTENWDEIQRIQKKHIMKTEIAACSSLLNAEQLLLWFSEKGTQT